jgi:hypothetical protein
VYDDGQPPDATLFITTLGSTPIIFTVQMTVPGMPY